MDQPTPTFRRRSIIWLRRIAIFYLLIVIAAMLFESSLIFLGAGPSWRPLKDKQFQAVSFPSATDQAMYCWWLPPPDEQSPVVLFFNGNGGNACGCETLALQMQKHLKCGVLLMDYPGYGKSEGTPNEASCYANATGAMNWLIETKNIPANRIVLLGLSLGGGVAVETATKYPVRGVALVSTYTTLPAAAKNRFPFLPTHWLMRNRFDSLSKIGTIKAPIFIAHGTDDRTIPYSQGETLYAAANEPKQFLRMEGKNHNDCLCVEMLQELRRFLDHTIR
jgi:fermentation-respiration switch protein FrsA (DUF1100 family)